MSATGGKSLGDLAEPTQPVHIISVHTVGLLLLCACLNHILGILLVRNVRIMKNECWFQLQSKSSPCWLVKFPPAWRLDVCCWVPVATSMDSIPDVRIERCTKTIGKKDAQETSWGQLEALAAHQKAPGTSPIYKKGWSLSWLSWPFFPLRSIQGCFTTARMSCRFARQMVFFCNSSIGKRPVSRKSKMQSTVCYVSSSEATRQASNGVLETFEPLRACQTLSPLSTCRVSTQHQFQWVSQTVKKQYKYIVLLSLNLKHLHYLHWIYMCMNKSEFQTRIRGASTAVRKWRASGAHLWPESQRIAREQSYQNQPMHCETSMKSAGHPLHWCTEKWTLLRLCSWQCSWKHGRNRHLRDLSTLTLTVRSVTFHGKTASRQMPQLPRKTQGLRLRPKKSTPPASVRCRIFLPWGINCKNTSWMFTLDEILYHIIYVYILTY